MEKKFGELKYTKLSNKNGKRIYLHDIDILDINYNILRKYRGVTTKEIKISEGDLEFV